MKVLLGLIAIVLVALGMYSLFAHRPALQPAPTPQFSADVYPLYQNATWAEPHPEQFLIGTTTYSGMSVASARVEAGMDPSSIFTPFEKYYDQKLTSLGWSIANDLAAGGHTGGQTGYRKGSDIILTRFQIDYQTNPPDAPSECPCTVTLSLFSGK